MIALVKWSEQRLPCLTVVLAILSSALLWSISFVYLLSTFDVNEPFRILAQMSIYYSVAAAAFISYRDVEFSFKAYALFGVIVGALVLAATLVFVAFFSVELSFSSLGFLNWMNIIFIHALATIFPFLYGGPIGEAVRVLVANREAVESKLRAFLERWGEEIVVGIFILVAARLFLNLLGL